MDSDLSYFLIWSLCIKRLIHHEGILYTLVLSLVLFIQSLYILSNLRNFHLLVSLLFFTAFTVVTSFKSSVITCPFMANVTQSEPKP